MQYPKYLYHKSNPSNRHSILKNGLKPSVGLSYKMHYDENDNLTPYVFLYDHDTIKNGEYDTTYNDDIYRIKTSLLDKEKLNKDIDISMEGCFVYSELIHPNEVELVYRGNGLDLLDISEEEKDKHSWIYLAK